jgi:hypothetical protein
MMVFYRRMKQLTKSEIETLAALLRRAQETRQLNINVASPYAEGQDWKKDGWTFNDRHDGNAVLLSGCNVEVSVGSGEEPVFKGDESEPEWKEYKNRPEVAIFVDDRSLCSLFGISVEEANAVYEAKKARASKAGSARSIKKSKAAKINWKKAAKAIKRKAANS